MNNEMLPMIGLVFLQQQTDRIVQEVRTSNDAKKFADELITSMSNTPLVQANIKFQHEQKEEILKIQNSIINIEKRMEEIFLALTSQNESSAIPAVKEEKKSFKK